MKHDRSFDKFSKEELQAISRRAGIASGKARREKREAINQIKINNTAHQECMREEIAILKMASSELRRAKRAMEKAGLL